MNQFEIQFKTSPKNLLANLTDAAYRIALNSGIQKPFIELELEIWNALREVLREEVVIQKISKNNFFASYKIPQLSQLLSWNSEGLNSPIPINNKESGEYSF